MYNVFPPHSHTHTHSPSTLLQVDTLTEGVGESFPYKQSATDTSSEVATAANVTAETLRLEDTYWAPFLLHLFAVVHFLLSLVLIASYWHFKVRGTHADVHVHIIYSFFFMYGQIVSIVR